MSWTREARERLRAVPSFLQGMVIRRVEAAAREEGQETVTPELMRKVRQRAFAQGGPFPAVRPAADEQTPESGIRKEERVGSPAAGSEEGSITWTEEARKRVDNAPAFVRPGILKLMETRARQRDYPVITSEFLTEIRNESMMRVAKIIRGFGFEEMSAEAFSEAKRRMRRNLKKVEVIGQIEQFLAERTEKNQEILEKFRQYLGVADGKGLPWTPEALEWLRQEMEPQDEHKRQIERRARKIRAPVVSLELIRELEMETPVEPRIEDDCREA